MQVQWTEGSHGQAGVSLLVVGGFHSTIVKNANFLGTTANGTLKPISKWSAKFMMPKFLRPKGFTQMPSNCTEHELVRAGLVRTMKTCGGH